jgi:hypothetical protein
MGRNIPESAVLLRTQHQPTNSDRHVQRLMAASVVMRQMNGSAFCTMCLLSHSFYVFLHLSHGQQVDFQTIGRILLLDLSLLVTSACPLPPRRLAG